MRRNGEGRREKKWGRKEGEGMGREGRREKGGQRGVSLCPPSGLTRLLLAAS